MTESIVSKWNARYVHTNDEIPSPSEVLARGARWLPKAKIETSCSEGTQRRALDLACGLAGNANYLANAGFDVTAWDISDVVVEKLRSRVPAIIGNIEQRDIIEYPPEPDSFDVIVVSRFLDRGLCEYIAKALKPEGVLFYQTFSKGLRNKSYILQPNELLNLFSSLLVLEYQESDDPVTKNSDSRIVGTSEQSVTGGPSGCAEASLIARRCL